MAKSKEQKKKEKQEYDHQRRVLIKEELRAKRARYYAENKEESKAKALAWHYENRERHLEVMTKYRAENIETIAASQKLYREKHKDKSVEDAAKAAGEVVSKWARKVLLTAATRDNRSA